MHHPDVVILLFASGKLVCTGATHEQIARIGQVSARVMKRLKEGC